METRPSHGAAGSSVLLSGAGRTGGGPGVIAGVPPPLPGTMESPWIQTYSRRKFFLLAPRVADVCLEDISRGLGHICRFTGQIEDFYSVAEHCVRVSWCLKSRGCSPLIQLQGLLHDSPEAYLNDISSPLKRAAGLEGYRLIEGRVQETIFKAFGVPPYIARVVHHVDEVLLATEARDLFPSGPRADFPTRADLALPVRIVPWAPRVARSMYEDTFRLLAGLVRPQYKGGLK